MDAFEAGAEPPKSIALCLSGGGLRATFFHLGVVTALREAGLLGRVTEVYSVSGGSITAGHVALNWSRYNGSDKDFAAVSAELRAIGDWDIRNRVLRRWMLGSWLFGLGRTQLLQKQYERLFGAATLSSCRFKDPSAPKFYILATSFNTGDLCSFTNDSFTVHSETPADGYGYDTKALRYPGDNIRLSYAVAASSAFPPLFPPLLLTWDRIGGASEGGFNAIALTDGGVFDNLGFEKFVSVDADKARSGNTEPPADAVVVSDASGTFNSAIHDDFNGILKRNIRATDVLMRRNAKATVTGIKTMREQRRRISRISIARTSPGSALTETAQTRLQNIRTDLDRFSKSEVDMLVAHGRDVMRDELKRAPPLIDVYVRQLGLTATAAHQESAERLARRSGTTRLGILNIRDWATFALVGAVAGLIWLCASGINWTYTTVREEIANYDAVKERAKKLNEDLVRLERVNAAHLSALGTAVNQGRASAPPTTLPVQRPDPQPAEAPAATDRSRYTVWIQFAGSLTREQMKGFGTKIRTYGWKAPGSEQGGERIGRAAGLNEVRYGPGTDRRVAELLAADIAKAGIVPADIGVKRLDIIPDNSLEIWISN